MNILKFFQRTTGLVLIVFFCVAPAQAAVPKLLSYQGILKDSSGNFLTGTYSMTFRLYSAASGGSALWTETQSTVSASSGKFSVQLGSVTALNLDFNTDYWLSMQVGADAEMSPRVRLTSMGYGIRSDYENNGFTQSSHDALTHKNVEGVKDNAAIIAKTNFKLDAYSLAAANSLGDLIVDAFNDSTGINAGASSDYAWRGSPNYDVIANAGGIDAYAVTALHTNGTDASTTFTDSSSASKTVTAFGNAQIDTAQLKFGSASALFDGSGDYLQIADSADWDASGDYSVDFWARFPGSVPSDAYFVGQGDHSGGTGGGWILLLNNGNLTLDIQNVANKIAVAPGFSANTWYHVAWTRSGGNNRLFVNGTQVGSTVSDSTSTTSSNALRIGLQHGGGKDMNGWIDELRISKGIARWTANFTPASAEYTSASGSATVISNAYTEPSAPTSAMVVVDETLGTGSITYSVSRDNGTTWTACTKDTVTDISSQPSGTQLKWKASITGDAELNAIAVAV